MARTPVRLGTTGQVVRLSGGEIVKVTPRTTSTVDPAFSALTTVQVSGTTNQAQGFFTFSNRPSGTVYCRFVSAYAGQGKDIAGGFSLSVPINTTTNAYSITSLSNLTVGLTYTPIYYWQDNPLLSTDVWPLGNAVQTGPAITITAPEVPATVINPSSFNVVVDTPAGVLLKQLTTDVLGGTFTQGTPANSLINLSAIGAVTSATILSTIAASTIKVIHTNAGGVFPQDVTMNVIAASTNPDKPTATATVATRVAVLAQLDAWLAAPSMTHRCVALSATDLSAWDMGSRDFSAANGHGGVTIRSSGTFTENDTGPVCSVQTGAIDFQSAKNIVFSLIQCHGNHDMGTSEDCGWKYAAVEGPNRVNVFANFETETFANADYVVELNQAVRPIAYRCAFLGGDMLIHCGTGGTLNYVPEGYYVGNVLDQIKRDEVRFTEMSVTPDWTWAWNAHVARRLNPGGNHGDVYQNKGNRSRANHHHNWVHDRFRHGVATANSLQVWFFGTGSEASTGCNYTQELLVANNGGIKDGGADSDATFITNISTIPDPNSPGPGIGTTRKDYNLLASGANKANQAGPNGLFLVQPDNDTTGAHLINNFEGVPSKLSSAGAVKPLVGTRGHWNYSDPNGRVGCHDLMRLCFDGADYDNWMEWGWPTRPLFHVAMDFNYELASSFGTSTTYDSNGNSV